MIYDKWHYRAIAYHRYATGVFYIDDRSHDWVLIRQKASELRELARQRKNR